MRDESTRQTAIPMASRRARRRRRAPTRFGQPTMKYARESATQAERKPSSSHLVRSYCIVTRNYRDRRTIVTSARQVSSAAAAPAGLFPRKSYRVRSAPHFLGRCATGALVSASRLAVPENKTIEFLPFLARGRKKRWGSNRGRRSSPFISGNKSADDDDDGVGSAPATPANNGSIDERAVSNLGWMHHPLVFRTPRINRGQMS